MILVVGLSSVWQRTLFFPRFNPGEVNRATRVLETASGKGVNVARVITLLGAHARVLTSAGGTRGELFQKALKADGVPATIIPISGETRLCQTLVGAGKHEAFITELVEEAPALSPAEVDSVLSAYSRLIRQARIVVLSGTVPGGCGEDFYAGLAERANRHSVPVLVDTQRAQLLGVVRKHPALVKINCSELAEATGTKSVVAGVRALMKLGAGQVVISRGAQDSLAFDGKRSWRVKPPVIKVVNPIGSGDSMMAGMAVGLSRHDTLEAALRLGVICGAANALTETSGVIQPAWVEKSLGRSSGHTGRSSGTCGQ